MGNLYRVLRALEADGLVSSEWNDDAPGPAKRIYGSRRGPAPARRVGRGPGARTAARRFLERYQKGRELRHGVSTVDLACVDRRNAAAVEDTADRRAADVAELIRR